MTPKALAKDLCPPMLWRAASRARTRLRRGLLGRRRPEYQYLPDGWTYAEAHPEVRGWNVPDIVGVYRRKWPRFVELVRGTGPLGFGHEGTLDDATCLLQHNIIMSFGYVAALAACARGALSLLDWGGGIGHYCLLARSLLPGVALEYHCKDVPLLAEEGARLFPEEHFHSDRSCLARTYDLVMASTSLLYEQDWKGLLKALAGAAAGYLYIANTPMVLRAPSFVFVQRPYEMGYNTEYLGWCLNRSEVIETAEESGMRLVREFVCGHRPEIAGAPEQNEYRSLLFAAGGTRPGKPREEGGSVSCSP